MLFDTTYTALHYAVTFQCSNSLQNAYTTYNATDVFRLQITPHTIHTIRRLSVCIFVSINCRVVTYP
jgi:hypothetical protein